MKRCPQCEFIYEDDQSLCDMDGVLLVFDSRTLPNLHALAPVEVPVAPKAAWRHRTFPAMAALILASVLSLVYFVSTQRVGYSPAPINGAAGAQPSTESVLTDKPANADQAPPPPATEDNGIAVPVKEEVKAEPAKETAQPSAPASSAASAPAKKAAVKGPATPTRTEEPKKEDSKVGSILKKTGRILKKPFKL